MVRSMTGFAKASYQSRKGSFSLEILSINKKYLEIFTYLPKELFFLEIPLKKKIEKHIFRGQITLRVTYTPLEYEKTTILPDFSLVECLKEGWEGYAKKLQLPINQIDITFLAHLSKQFLPDSKGIFDKQLEKDLFEQLEKVIDSLIQMKEEEGEALCKDVVKQILSIEKELAKIEKMAKEAPLHFREKVEKRVKELLPMTEELEDRVIREVLLLSDKVDITEEIIRLRSHIEQFSSLLKEEKVPSGRKADFICQEMFREINTISSKSLDVKLSHSAIEIKSALEKIRQQIQNIE